ncbi:hypothetical protein BH10PSE13_BH10PSE13_16560 [soil metagenome]
MNRTGAPQKGSQNDAHRDTEDAGTEGEVAVRMPVSGNARAAGPGKAGKSPRAQGKKGGAPGDVGQMLRGAYRQTVEEAIPNDLMDLLNKLE